MKPLDTYVYFQYDNQNHCVLCDKDVYFKIGCGYKSCLLKVRTKTVMPCSLQSIAAAHSKRLATTHWTENLSSLSLPANTKAKTQPVKKHAGCGQLQLSN